MCDAGQEIYYTTHEFFLSERSLYLVIFNLSKGLNAAYMEHWLQSIVATHLDQCAEEQVEAIALELTEKYSARFPNIKTVKFVSCSLGKGLGAVQEAIEEVVGSQEHMGERMPKSYMALERALIAERAKRVPPVLSWEEFRELAKRCGVDDDLGTLHHHLIIFTIFTINTTIFLSSTGASRGFGAAAAAGLRHEEETEGAPAKRGRQARQEQRSLRCHSAPAQPGLPRTIYYSFIIQLISQFICFVLTFL